jgi:hypothetical protein
MWREGISNSPDGEACQIPQKHTWNSTLWVTRNGEIRRRHWDMTQRRWRWASDQVELVMDENTGRMGVYLQPWWTSIEMCIGLAWIKRAELSQAQIELEEGRPLEKRYLRWRDGGEAAFVEPDDIEGEVWRPLTYRCGCVPCPSGYHISNRARLRSPTGEITRGFSFGDTRLAAVRNAGLVDLHAAARSRRVVDIPPRIRSALDALMTGHTPEDIAQGLSIAEDTAWSYAWDAGRHLPPARLWAIAQQIVSDDLLELLSAMYHDGDPLLSGTLRDLMAEVEETLSEDGAFANSDCKFAQLRFARMALEARS